MARGLITPIGEPDETGGQEFQLPGGEPTYVSGELADRFRQQAMSVGPEEEEAAPPPTTGGYAPDPILGGGTPAPGPTPQGGLPGGPQMTPYQQRAAARISQGVSIPGRPGVDPAKMIASGQMVPTGGSVQTTDITPFDEEYATEAGSIARDRARLAQAERDRGIADVERQRTQQTREAEENKIRQQDAQRELVEREQTWKKDESDLNQLLEEQKTKKVDPNRLFGGDRILLGIGAAIARAFGAYAAVLGGTQNFAGQVIDNAIDRDIRAQESELDELGRRSNNALARLERHYGNRQEAKAALEILQRQAVEQQRAELVTATRRADIQQGYQQALLDQRQKQAELLHQMKLGSQGKSATAQQQAFIQPQAAQGGGRRAMSIEERERIVDEEIKRARFRGEEMSPEQIHQLRMTKAKSGEREGAIQDKWQRTKADKLGSDLAAVADAEKSLLLYADSIGMKRNPDGSWTEPEGDIPGTGYTSGLPRAIMSEKGRRVQALRSHAGGFVVRAVSGATAREDEKRDMVRNMTGSWDKDASVGFRDTWAILQAKKKALEEGAGPEVLAEHAARKGDVQQQRLTQATATDPGFRNQ